MTSDNLKAWRNAQGITQNKASERLGLSLRQYQRLEAGGSKVSGPLARLIASK